MIWRIALLEDEQEYIDLICHITEKYMKEHHILYEIRAYTSVKELMSDFQKGVEEELYLLDIELPDGNGLDVAKCIREKGEDPFLIYITNYVQYAIAAFEVNTFRYIPKTVLNRKLPEAYQAMQKILEKRKTQEGQYLISCSSGKTVKVKYRDIVYLKKEGNYVKIFCAEDKYSVRKTLSEVVEELDYSKIMIIERGYAVNIQHIVSIKDHQVILSDGTVLQVARVRWKMVREAFLNWKE